MNKFLAIAKWEFMEKIKSKAMIISFFLTPLIILGFSILPSVFVEKDDASTQAIGIIDNTQKYFPSLTEKLSEFKLEDKQPRYVIINLFKQNEQADSLKAEANRNVVKKKIEGYIFLSENGKKEIVFEYRSLSLGNFNDYRRFEDCFNKIRRVQEFKKANIDTALVAHLLNNVEMNTVKIDEKGKESSADFKSQYFSSFIFIMVLFMVIMISGGMLVRSLVEEKSNRLIEIIVSSCRPDDILKGKILGLSGLTLSQIVVWALIGTAFAGQGIVMFASFQNLFLLFVYFILGFVLYTAIFVGVGSIVTTEQEAQQITGYLSMITISPIVIMIPAMQNPDSLLIRVFSYIPLTTPGVMILRLNSAPISTIEILATLLELILSIYLVIKVSSKIFRIGILSYGKMPNLKELFAWLREKE
ncbi:MAG: ABC transporter permease [Ignavibacteriaceae bacterium]|nr:ABC transporter permease [Ignavibacteriaceae bacterium]